MSSQRQHFESFSSWKCLIRSIANLIHRARGYNNPQSAVKTICRGWHYCQGPYSVQELPHAKEVVVRAVQEDT